MFDRFTDHAKKWMQFARQEAQNLNHEYIGTEHILLGAIRDRNGVAARVLESLDIDLDSVVQEVEQIAKPGKSMVTMGQLPFTPRAKAVLERSMDEASALSHDYIGTEHLLLGLIEKPRGKPRGIVARVLLNLGIGKRNGIAAQVLLNLGVAIEDVRHRVMESLGE